MIATPLAAAVVVTFALLRLGGHALSIFNLFGVLLGGVEHLLANPGGPPPQSGTFGVGNVPLIFFISCGADCAGVRRGS